MELKELQEMIQQQAGLLLEASGVPGNFLIMSPFVYPDGDFFNIYLVEDNPGEWRLTDAGETVRYLKMLDQDPFFILDEMEHIVESCLSAGVVYNGGEITAKLDSLDKLATKCMDVAMACMWISKLRG